MQSNGSRWGVKGSSEVSEGLTAVYRYEENLNLANATLGAGNRLSSVGLSGGFGTVTLGRIWSASYNHVGVLTDNGVWSGNNNSPTLRTSSNLSYSASTGPISFQLDAGMGAGTGRSLDMAQLGLSFDTGAATIGMAFTTEEDIDGKTKTRTGKTRTSAFGVSVPVGGLTLAGSWMETKTTRFATDGSPAVKTVVTNCYRTVGNEFIVRPAEKVKDSTSFTCAPLNVRADGSMRDPLFEKYIQTTTTPADPATKEKTDKAKQMRFSVTGGLGDTGMSFAVNVHNNPDKMDGENPWNVNVGKSLGGGASLAFEYIDNDSEENDNESLVQLRVDF